MPRKDGRHYIDQMTTAMAGLRERLTEGSMPLPPETAQEAAERLERLEEMLQSIRKRLFVKTQGGTEVAKECAAEVEKLEEVIDSLAGEPEEEAVARLEDALRSVEEKIEPFVDKTRSQVVRMT